MFKDGKQICLQKTSRQPICYRSGESSTLVPSYTRTALVSFLNVVIFLCQGTLPCHPIQSVRSQEWCPVDLPRNPGASSSLLTACCQKIPWCTGNENEGTRHKLMVMIYDNDNIMKIPQVIEAVLDVFVKSHLYVPLWNKKTSRQCQHDHLGTDLFFKDPPIKWWLTSNMIPILLLYEAS